VRSAGGDDAWPSSGDRSVYFKDPEDNVIEAWDFFEHGDGAREGVDALT
jgi:hypothetical protein